MTVITEADASMDNVNVCPNLQVKHVRKQSVPTIALKMVFVEKMPSVYASQDSLQKTVLKNYALKIVTEKEFVITQPDNALATRNILETIVEAKSVLKIAKEKENAPKKVYVFVSLDMRAQCANTYLARMIVQVTVFAIMENAFANQDS